MLKPIFYLIIIATRYTIAYQNWREKVLERDNYQCVLCGKKSTKREPLNVHHVLPYSIFPTLRKTIHNGITLCRFHHTELHRASLDVQLMPELYYLWKDGYKLNELLVQSPFFNELGNLTVIKYPKKELLRVTKPYKATLKSLYPEFYRTLFD